MRLKNHNSLSNRVKMMFWQLGAEPAFCTLTHMHTISEVSNALSIVHAQHWFLGSHTKQHTWVLQCEIHTQMDLLFCFQTDEQMEKRRDYRRFHSFFLLSNYQYLHNICGLF